MSAADDTNPPGKGKGEEYNPSTEDPLMRNVATIEHNGVMLWLTKFDNQDEKNECERKAKKVIEKNGGETADLKYIIRKLRDAGLINLDSGVVVDCPTEKFRRDVIQLTEKYSTLRGHQAAVQE